MKMAFRNTLLFVLMLTAAGLAIAIRPTQKVADTAPAINLAAMIPTKFGQWKEEVGHAVLIANPQQTALLDKIYNQVLTRTYIDPSGYRLMLSIAYGGDQSDALQLHKPEVCYPAQGFEVDSINNELIKTDFGTFPVVRLDAHMGGRYEKVTYWTTVGNQVVMGKVQKKLVEMSYGINGKIPDGVLFRVSSLDVESARAYSIQEQFICALLADLDEEGRRRLIGF